MRVLISTHDPMLNLVTLAETALEYYGEDVLEDEGIEIPDSLALEAYEVYRRLCELSNQLKVYKDEDAAKKWGVVKERLKNEGIL